MTTTDPMKLPTCPPWCTGLHHGGERDWDTVIATGEPVRSHSGSTSTYDDTRLKLTITDAQEQVTALTHLIELAKC